MQEQKNLQVESHAGTAMETEIESAEELVQKNNLKEPLPEPYRNFKPRALTSKSFVV